MWIRSTLLWFLVLIRTSVAMPSIGDVKGTGDVIDVVSTNGIDLGTENEGLLK